MDDQLALHGRTALLVEDEILVSMLAEEILEEAGCQVIVAMCLDQALDIAQDAQVDCAILDVNLGNGSTSFPVAEVLRDRAIPFIFVSGYGVEGVDRAFNSSCVVQKPYTPAQLVRAVGNCLSTDQTND